MAKTRNFCLNTAEAVDIGTYGSCYIPEKYRGLNTAEAVDIGTNYKKLIIMRQKFSLNTAEAVDIGTKKTFTILGWILSQYRRSSRHRYHKLKKLNIMKSLSLNTAEAVDIGTTICAKSKMKTDVSIPPKQ